jgi:hypothetical protein
VTTLRRWRAALHARRGRAGPKGDAAWIAAALALLAALLALGEWTWRLDRVIYDRALSWWPRPPPAEIVIVAIDDASVAAIGRWPWPRSVHATLLESLARTRPKAVLLDLLLSEADPQPEQDRLLAAAMRQAAPVVLPMPWLAVNGREPRWLEPVPELAGAARLASAEPAADADGILRHVFLQVGAPGAMVPHAALTLLQAAGEAPHPRLRPERLAATDGAGGAWQRDERLLLRYGGPPGHVRRVPYVDLLTGAVPASAIAGSYVLIGMTAQGLGDTLATPVNVHHHAMPGVEVIAQTLHMLRSGDTLRALSAPQVALVSALLSALGVLALARLGQRDALAAALGSTLALLPASVVAIGLGWWATPVPLMAAALLAYPLLSWRRLESAVRGLDREIRALAADTAALPAASKLDDPIDARLRRLHRAGTLLREARRFLADVLASLPNGMLVADARGRVLMGNAEAAALFEVGSPDELQALDLVRLLGEFATPQPTDWAALIAGLEPGGERPALQAQLAGQGDYVVQLAAAALAGERRVLVAIADVAPVKQAERQREEALAFVSHDLRSPAASIALLADMGLAGTGPAPPLLLAEVQRLARRLLAMSQDFVRYAQADLVALEPATVAVPDLLERAVLDLRPQAQAAGVALQVRAHDTQAVAAVDVELVVRAIANLVSNAIRHGPPGTTVQVRTLHEADGLVVQVRDQGGGLNARQRAALQSQDEGLRSEHASGLGLGLRFVQRVARRHGGQLRLPPVPPDAGAVFELVLPASASGDP